MSGRLHALWHNRGPLAWLLWPLGGLFCLLAVLRRQAYRRGLLRVNRLPVPVIIVGNITVGGTGKTPLTIWLAQFLQSRGLRPGIISRGHGGQAKTWPQRVDVNSDPRLVGDEPVLIAQQTGCPMMVGPDRTAAARALLQDNLCNVVLADDGLQHYALARDVEIAVIDGERRLGNGFCLPAGPLREPPARLATVDFRVCNGRPQRGEYGMQLQPGAAFRLSDGQRAALEDFAGRRVHAVAGIGHPARFFAMLRAHGIEAIEHAFADHHAFVAADLRFDDDGPVLMTAKDGVKCRGFADARLWVVPVEAVLPDGFGQRLMQLAGLDSTR